MQILPRGESEGLLVGFRPATNAERALTVPYFDTLPRLGRPPEVYIGGSDAEPMFIIGILPEAHIRHRGRDYYIELLLLDARRPDVDTTVGAALARLAWDMGADHFVTSFMRENSDECHLLQALGFGVEVRHHELSIAQSDAWNRIKGWEKLHSRDRGGIMIVPYESVAEEDSKRLHAQTLGVLPDGHHVLHGNLESSLDYSLSRAVLLNGKCCGALVLGRRDDVMQAEDVVIAPGVQGSSITGRLLYEVIKSCQAAGIREYRLRVADHNVKSLRLMRALGGKTVDYWLSLVWSGKAEP